MYFFLNCIASTLNIIVNNVDVALFFVLLILSCTLLLKGYWMSKLINESHNREAEIRGFHKDKDVDVVILSCNAMCTCKNTPTFQSCKWR
jgi:hypothetical protein